ncbi:hypothetical protein [Streptomyces sp. AK02-01A]|uniref:hypothetical protein n=1 Tax=Streptomyces sp. AK02-01A TaxID=3028648 RepID=UPI0029BD18EA|nr:hypothetical protein [Streptomyces sp. AK02-01A]MDX3853260.1 hypothetical protein [Streptomyces sp. AK02-01A]
MSNDQQHPYGQDQPHSYGQYGDGQYGDGQYGDGQYGDQGAYDQYGHPRQPSHGAHQDQDASRGWAEPRQPAPGHADAAAAQTWEGQTWDTQFQPQVGRQQGQGHQAPYQPQQRTYQSQQQQQSAAADTAYLPPQGGYPLPPEASAAAPAPHESAAPAAAPSGDGYNAPTTMGNARITDAQRARAEGRSPIIPPGMQPAGLTALLGLLLAAGAAVGPYALLVPLVLLQAVTAAGWFRLNGMWPARQGIALAFLGGVTADVVLLAVGKENAPAAIIGTLGVWVLLTVVLQLRSRAGADERMQGLMATLASAALAIIATGHLAAVPDAVVVGALAVAATTVVRALPLPGVVSVVVALLVAAGAGLVAGGLTDLGSGAALLGLGAGVCALVGLRAASYDYPSRFVHMTAGVALPLTAAAPVVYLLGRVLF